MPVPDFTSPTIFPPFNALPFTTTTPSSPSPSPSQPKNHQPPPGPTHEAQAQDYYLLAQITHNMTLTKPTLILADRAGTSFALVYTSRPGAGPDAPDLAARGMRRGATVVLRGARRT
ncbi:uncharacterized protein THITE_27976, partial [Thermothielavioides terrestris NRRL 8126]